jgi:hypothetical protein
MEPNQDRACAAAPQACPGLSSCAPYGSFLAGAGITPLAGLLALHGSRYA